MSIFTVNIKRILKSKVQLFFLILFPLMMMSMSVLEVKPTLKAAVIDKDGTKLTALLAKEMGTVATLVTIQEENLQKELMGLTADYVLVVDKGFTEGIIRGESPRVQGYYVEESNLSLPIKSFVESFLHNGKLMAQAARHDEAAFYQALNIYQAGSMTMKYEEAVDPQYQNSRAAFGFMAVSMLYASMVTAMLILMNKSNRTFYRTLAAPIRIRSYMLQNAASFIVIAIIQIVVLFAVLKFGFGLYMGPSVLQMVLLFVVFALVSVALGITISAHAKSIVQACILGICTIPPMAMLGGAYFPMDNVPDAIKALAQFVPVTWAMQAVDKLLREQSFAAIAGDLAVLIVFAAIFFLLGTLRKTDLAK